MIMNKGEYYERKYKEDKERQAKYDKERKERQEKVDKERYNKKRSDFIFGRDGKGSIFTLLLTILLILTFSRILLGQELNVSFKSFLEMLSSVPDVSLSWLSGLDLTIYADWGAFNFFRDYLNMFGLEPLEVFLMICGAIMQLLSFITYILSYIFNI